MRRLPGTRSLACGRYPSRVVRSASRSKQPVQGRGGTTPRWLRTDLPIRVGVSRCLLGDPVRYDGGHKRSRFVSDDLGRFVTWVPVCPEVEAGMGVPRPAIRIVQPAGSNGEDAQRLEEVASGRRHTAALRRTARSRVARLAREDLCGFVLKKDSPSCGMERVRVWSDSPSGGATRTGRGLFARTLIDRLPHLPVEEEGRLEDPALRERFVERVFAYRRLKSLFETRWTLGELVRFHTAHKMQLLAHAERDYRALGRLVAGARDHSPASLRDEYSRLFMRALATQATRRRHVNVLQHMTGHLRDHLDGGSRRELADVIDDYRAGLVPLVVPITLIRHHVRRLEVVYLEGQVYLEPHPKELMLRNRA